MKNVQSLVVIALVLAMGSVAEAQLFGERPLGETLRRRPGPRSASQGGASQGGELQGNERFLRQNRGRSDFVGPDRRDVRGFVGVRQARTSGTILSSIAGLRQPTDRSSQINRPLKIPDSDEPYLPKLGIGFSVPPAASTNDLELQLTEQLAQSERFSEKCRIEVSVEGRTAILRGEVTSASERDLAELVALIEPGISQVKNALKVVGMRLDSQPRVSPRDSSAPRLPPPPRSD